MLEAIKPSEADWRKISADSPLKGSRQRPTEQGSTGSSKEKKKPHEEPSSDDSGSGEDEAVAGQVDILA